MTYENENDVHDGFEDNYSDTPTEDNDFDLDEHDYSLDDDESGAQDEVQSEEETVQERLLRLKYNGEEMDLPESEVIQLAQMGKNYDKVFNQLNDLRNDPRLSFLDELAQENGYDNPHEFVTEFRAMQEQARLDELVANNIPEEYAREMLESQKFRAEMQEQRQQQEQQQREVHEYQDFFDAYRQANGKDFVPGKDQIPQEVLDIRQGKNIPLRYAFMEFNQQQMANQLSIYKQNETNGKKATIKGGITKHGTGDNPIDDFILGFDSDSGW